MPPRLLACVLLALAALPAAGERPAVENKRGTYAVQYATAKALAGILTKHFKGAAEIQPGPDGTSNCLLINAPPAVYDEVLKVLEKLHGRRHAITVELFVVELPRKKDGEKGP